MRNRRRNLEISVSIILVTVFLGQIYISPFGTDFRLSMAVISLSFLLLFFREVNVLFCTTVVGFLMFFFRAGIAAINNPGIGVDILTAMYLPVVVYYVFYGVLFIVMELRDKAREPVSLTVSLWVIDSLPNILEVIVRQEWNYSPFDNLIMAIILMGGIRSIITYQLIAMADSYTDHVESNQKEKQFRQLLLFTARLKTELFFLRKSRQDIELAMKKSHEVYQRVENPELKPMMLSIAKDIHEIKKDYNRVISGMENTLGKEEPGTAMSILELFSLIKDNTDALLEQTGKAIHFEFSVASNTKTTRYYPLVSVLNNLVINAVEAIEDDGVIRMTERCENGSHLFSVSDNGPGIPEEDLEAVFVPGYSTKFNPETGNMSTGIGLTHARQIVEEVFHSRLEVHSSTDGRTEFRFTIQNLEGDIQ